MVNSKTKLVRLASNVQRSSTHKHEIFHFISFFFALLFRIKLFPHNSCIVERIRFSLKSLFITRNENEMRKKNRRNKKEEKLSIKALTQPQYVCVAFLREKCRVSNDETFIIASIVLCKRVVRIPIKKCWTHNLTSHSGYERMQGTCTNKYDFYSRSYKKSKDKRETVTIIYFPFHNWNRRLLLHVPGHMFNGFFHFKFDSIELLGTRCIQLEFISSRNRSRPTHEKFMYKRRIVSHRPKWPKVACVREEEIEWKRSRTLAFNRRLKILNRRKCRIAKSDHKWLMMAICGRPNVQCPLCRMTDVEKLGDLMNIVKYSWEIHFWPFSCSPPVVRWWPNYATAICVCNIIVVVFTISASVKNISFGLGAVVLYDTI